MGLPALAAVVVAALVLGYRFYGRYVAAQFALDDATVTPAHRKADGVDFVPTRPFYLFGQHFSAIAAAGPIVGPILACQQFGWLPCLMWIAFGVVFIGAVHDASALVASVRHPIHVLQSARIGADVATIPYKVIEQLAQHPLTDKGLKQFLADWEKVPKV